MNAVVLAALIGLISSVVAAVIAYWTTKRREREAEWRREKLGYYKTLVESLSGIVEGDSTPEGHRLFARATNNLLLFAPETVLVALQAFRDEISISNPVRSQERHDELLAALLFAIRHDIGVIPPDDPTTFTAVLWASGAERDRT